MTKRKYSKYVVKNPRKVVDVMHHAEGLDVEFFPHKFFIDKELVPGAAVNVQAARILGIGPSPILVEKHKHSADEVILVMSSTADDELGGEVEIAMGEEEEKYSLTQSGAVFIPGNMVHCPLVVKSVDKNKPILVVAFEISPEYD